MSDRTEPQLDHPVVQLGDGSSGTLKIIVLGREVEHAQLPSDADWLKCRLEVATPGFTGATAAPIGSAALSELRDMLEAIKTLPTTLRWASDEEHLSVTIDVQRQGAVRCTGVLRSDNESSVGLSFALDSDLAQLDGLRKELDRILLLYPIPNGI